MITQKFLLDARVALEIQKSRTSISNRIYSHLVESLIRQHPKYPDLLRLRKDKSADRKKTAALVKRLLKEQLEVTGLALDDFAELFRQTKDGNVSYRMLVEAEKTAFKELTPQLEQIPVYAWLTQVRGLGVRYAVKLIFHIRDIKRFENPSKLRKYCGCAPDQKLRRGAEAGFNPELKGVLLGQIAENFIKNVSQYKRLYDEKKAYYFRLHPEALAVRAKGVKVTKDDWTRERAHNFSKKAMVNRFLVDLWMAWYLSEGLVPPKNPYIAELPCHSLEPMVVPFVAGSGASVKKKRGRKKRDGHE